MQVRIYYYGGLQLLPFCILQHQAWCLQAARIVSKWHEAVFVPAAARVSSRFTYLEERVSCCICATNSVSFFAVVMLSNKYFYLLRIRSPMYVAVFKIKAAPHLRSIKLRLTTIEC
ncbi:hypothetical protein OK016_16410 [Vibrio chagasii]|nr:hypothetical protein [Vibrio chagasii]